MEGIDVGLGGAQRVHQFGGYLRIGLLNLRLGHTQIVQLDLVESLGQFAQRGVPAVPDHVHYVLHGAHDLGEGTFPPSVPFFHIQPLPHRRGV